MEHTNQDTIKERLRGEGKSFTIRKLHVDWRSQRLAPGGGGPRHASSWKEAIADQHRLRMQLPSFAAFNHNIIDGVIGGATQNDEVVDPSAFGFLM